MNDLLEWPVTVEDVRQQAKVKHLMRDIIAIVCFAELAAIHCNFNQVCVKIII